MYVENSIIGLMIGVVNIKVKVVCVGIFFFINWCIIGIILYL